MTYQVEYREMQSDTGKVATFGSLRAARKWARAFVSAAYRNEARARLVMPSGYTMAWLNQHGRAVRQGTGAAPLLLPSLQRAGQ